MTTVYVEPQRAQAVHVRLLAAAGLLVARAGMIDRMSKLILLSQERRALGVRREKMITDVLPGEQRCAA